MFIAEKFSVFLFLIHYSENSELTKTDVYSREILCFPLFLLFTYGYSDATFLDDTLMAYEGYITKLLHNLDNRFEDKTFDICVDIGKLFNFHSLLYPCTGELMVAMDPLNIETSEDIFAVLNNLSFID